MDSFNNRIIEKLVVHFDSLAIHEGLEKELVATGGDHFLNHP